MKTTEAKTTSAARNTKAKQLFFSKEGKGGFFGESIGKDDSFFKPSSAYAVNRNAVLQTRLTIGQPNDKYEQEADAMAEKVVQRLSNPEPLTKKDSGIQAKPLLAGITPLVQSKCATCEPALSAGRQDEKLQKKEEEELMQESPLELRRKPIFESNGESPDDENNIQRKCAECLSAEVSAKEGEKEEKLQTKSDSPATSANIERSLNSFKGSGSPIPEGTRRQMESSFGADFSDVRLHTDSSAVQMNRDLHAQAFTHGSDIYFNSGKYEITSKNGQRLLAHELTHVVQQNAGFIANATQFESIQRDDDDLGEPVFEPTEEAMYEMDEGTKIETDGVVQMEEGTFLWSEPDPERKKPALGLLSFNTHLFVDRKLDGGWFSVYVQGHQEKNGSIPVEKGTHGYVAAERISIDLPDPGARLFRIKSGQGALAVAGEAYNDNFTASWGKDYRFLVNVLAMVNEEKGRKFLYKENLDDSWADAKTMRGGQIWVPGMQLVDAMHGQVSSGSISYEVLSTLGNILIGVGGFIVGLLHGALMSIADIFIGIYDLIKLLGEIFLKLIKGTLISDAVAFFKEISQIKWADIKDILDSKWNHPNIWNRWKFRGYVVGYTIMEIVILFFSIGILTAVKWVGKLGKFGKLASYLAKLPRINRFVQAAKGLKGKAINQMRATLKAAHALSEAHGWAARILRIPMSILQRLSEVDIRRLKKLPQWVREKFARLSEKAMLRLLGCHSPCKVDAQAIEEALKLVGKVGNKLTDPDAVLKALKNLPEKLNLQKIATKLRKKSSALMTAIKEAGLTDADFAKLADFLTPGDLASPAQAYQTFIRYLTAAVPAKTGKDLKKLNQILESIVKSETRRGSAMKGAMFEQWVALHVPELSSKLFKRVTFDLRALLKKVLPPYSRTVDKWVANAGEIWDMKHQFSKVPVDQIADYAALVGKVAPDGKLVKSINYLFPTEAAAKLNRHIADTYKMGVWFIDEATNKLTKLL